MYSHRCKDISRCKIPSIKRLLIGSNYFKYRKNRECSCIIRTPTYSREWDSEFNETFQKRFGGIQYARNIIKDILNLSPDLHSDYRTEISPLVKEIPRKYRIKIVELIDKVISDRGLQNYVHRVLIFHQEEYRGYIDVNHFGDICDVYIKPPLYMKAPTYFVTCERRFLSDFVLRQRTEEVDAVECVPYNKAENGTIGVCAQYSARTALFCLMQHPPTVPELAFRASRKFIHGGLGREQSEGWTPEELKNILEYEGFNTFRYHRRHCKKCKQPITKLKCDNCGTEESLHRINVEPSLRNIYAYVESGLPVIIGIEDAFSLPWWKDKPIREDTNQNKHALVVIGHTMTKGGSVNGLIVHDVSTYPYQILTKSKDGGPLEEIIFEAISITPRDVVVSYEVVDALFEDTFTLGKDETYRAFLVESDSVIKWLAEGKERKHFESYNIPEKVKNDFKRAHWDKYMWLFEMKKEIPSSNKYEYVGDVLFSATRIPTTEEDIILALNLPQQREYLFYDTELNCHHRNY